MVEIARIVASYRKLYVVDCQDQRRRVASARKKKTHSDHHLACGDYVLVQLLNEHQAVIEQIQPRQSLFYRSDASRSKLIAANATQVIIVVAPVPHWHPELLERCLIAAQGAGIHPLICLNKCDLPEATLARSDLSYYLQLGYDQIEIAANHKDILPLYHRLQGQTSVLLGQSGVGKSTIMNTLVPDAQARVGEISRALGTGKHTTTHTALYSINDNSDLIDTPGLQSFGLMHLPANTLPGFFNELTVHLGHCRFHDCQHRAEPGCAIQAAVQAGQIRPSRLALLHRLQDEYKRKSYHR